MMYGTTKVNEILTTKMKIIKNFSPIALKTAEI